MAGEAAHRAPPIHGPITEPAWKPRLFQAMARGSSALGTSMGASEEEAGCRKARLAPNTAATTNTGVREGRGCSDSPIKARSQTICTSRHAWMISRRSWRSATWPAGRVKANSGRNCASPTMPTRKAPCLTDRCWARATV